MSIRYTVTNKENIELSDDKTEIEVLFKSDNSGNHYVDISLDLVLNLLQPIFSEIYQEAIDDISSKI